MTAVDTNELPQPGNVVLLRSDPDFFAVLDYHDMEGWRLIRIVRASKLGRYRVQYPGPTRAVQAPAVFSAGAPASFVRETRQVPPDEPHQFLSVVGTLERVDLEAARGLVR